MSRRQQRQERSNRYYIRTTAGNVIYDGSDQITVQVAPQSFLRKRVADLNTGELVLYDVRQVRTTLEDVEPHLHRSPLYSRALDYVHVENSTGERVPRLRVALMHSLAERGIVDSENLEQKILNENMEMFSGAEYQQGAEYLHNVLANSNAPERFQVDIPQQATIKNWLDGTTKAPGEHTIFRILQRELGDEFRYFISDNPEDPDSFYRNYRIWAVMRQQVMKTLNAWRGLTVGTPPDQVERQSHIDITREKALILSHFLKDVTPELKAVMVTDIERLSPRRAYDVRRTDRLVGEGVIRGEIRDITNRLRNYNGFLQDMAILKNYFAQAVSDYRDSNVNEIEGMFFEKDQSGALIMGGARAFRYMIAEEALPLFLELFGERLDPEMRFIQSDPFSLRFFTGLSADSLRRYRNGLSDLLNSIKNSVLDCSMDDFYGFEEGTLTRLLESFFRTRKALPDSLFDYIVKNRQELIRPDKKAKIRRDINSLKPLLTRAYGFRFTKKGEIVPTGFFFLNELSSEIAKQGDATYREIFMETERTGKTWFQTMFQRFLNNDKSKLRRIVNSQEKGIFILTKDYVKAILSQYNLEQIIDLRKDEFILEDTDIPFPKPPRELYPN